MTPGTVEWWQMRARIEQGGAAAHSRLADNYDEMSIEARHLAGDAANASDRNLARYHELCADAYQATAAYHLDQKNQAFARRNIALANVGRLNYADEQRAAARAEEAG